MILDDSQSKNIKFEKKPTLVILHGYAAAFVLLYTILKPSMCHYRIVGIDLLGFGASTRLSLPEELTKNNTAIDEYQVTWLEKWVDLMTSAGELP